MDKRYSSAFIVILLVVLISFVSISKVSAQEITPTPSMTGVPGMMVTVRPTGTAISDISCPTGMPAQWLTKTPSTLWDLYCSSCVVSTLQSLPTANPTITRTPTKTVTPSPTSTGTITPLAPTVTGTPNTSVSQYMYIVPGGYNHTYTYLGEEWDFDTVLETGIPYGARRDYKAFLVNNLVTSTYKGVVDTTLHVGLSCGGTMYFYFNNRTLGNIVLLFDDEYKTDSQIIAPMTEVLIKTHVYNSGWTGDIRRYFQVDVLLPNYPDGEHEDFNYRWWYQLGCANSSYKVSNNFKTGEFDLASTPTPQPAQSYCSVVEGDDADEDLFGFEGLEFGNKYCFDLGGWEFNALGLEVNIPLWLHLCLQNLSFGVLTIFGVTFSIDTIFYGIAVVWGIGWMLK